MALEGLLVIRGRWQSWRWLKVVEHAHIGVCVLRVCMCVLIGKEGVSCRVRV